MHTEIVLEIKMIHIKFYSAFQICVDTSDTVHCKNVF